MSFHVALEAALPPDSLAPRRMDASTFCGFREFELLRSSSRDLVAVNDDEVRSMRWYRAVSGHFSLTTLLQITDAPAIGTILREPRARVMSLYLYWRTPNLFDTWLPYSVEEHALLPLDRFMAEPRLAPAVDNQVCRMLLHGDPRIPQEGFIAETDVDAIAADAIAQLDTLGFVGVLELGDSAWHGLARLFGVELEPKRVNVTGDLGNVAVASPGEKLLTVAALDLLAQRSAADRIVYDHALAIAGVRGGERLRLVESAFAAQLVRLGDLLGSSAAKHARAIDEARAEFEQKELLNAEVAELRARLDSRERVVRELGDEIERRAEEVRRVRRWLDAVHASASWRVTAPLRAGKQMLRARRGA
jgi:hypothetical protein